MSPPARTATARAHPCGSPSSIANISAVSLEPAAGSATATLRSPSTQPNHPSTPGRSPRTGTRGAIVIGDRRTSGERRIGTQCGVIINRRTHEHTDRRFGSWEHKWGIHRRSRTGGVAVSQSIEDQPVALARQHFAVRQIRRLRQLVAWAAHRVGLDRERGRDLALAVTEAASNVIRYGGGHGRLDLLQDDDRALIAEISDDGPGMAPDLPAALPPAERGSGRGRYLMEQSCDHVEYRSGPTGTTVHLEVNLHHEHDQP